MSLEKIISVDLVEVVESGVVQVRAKTVIMENGVEISTKFHRHVVAPGDNYSAEDLKVQSICNVVHTADVISAYKAKQL